MRRDRESYCLEVIGEMKKWWAAAAVLLLGWMIWLTVSLVSLQNKEPVSVPFPEESEESGVIHNTIVGYTTDITKVVADVRPHVVSVTGVTEDRELISSGVIYAVSGNDTWIVSACDVLREDIPYVVRFDNGLTVEAELKGADPLTDTALFLCHPDFDVKPIELGSTRDLTQGEYVVVLGARNLHTQSGETGFGIVSLPGMFYRHNEALEKDWITETVLTDIPLLEETSGGPLINLSGQMVGMMSSSYSTNYRGVSMAVGMSDVIPVVEELRKSGEVSRGYLGIVTRDIKDLELYQKSAMNISLDITSGVVVTEVIEGSPAQENGIQPNDVILMADDMEIPTGEALRKYLYEKNAGEPAVLSVQRQGTISAVTAELR